MALTAELLTSLSLEELQALADCQLAPSAQARLSDLLERCREHELGPDENAELDRIVQQADQLMLVKTRARLTLNQMQAGIAGV